MFSVTDERSPLLIIEPDASSVVQAPASLDHPEQGEHGKAESSPVDELARGLLGKDGEQAPGDGDGGGEVALGGGEGVSGGGAFEEEETDEDEDFGPDSSEVVAGIYAKGGESGEDDEDGGPPVPEGEGEVDEDFIGRAGRDVVLLDEVVDVGDSRRNEEREDKGNCVVLAGPQVDIDGIKDDQQGETPGNGINDDGLSGIRELVDNGAEKKKVDQGPDKECPWRGGDVSLFSVVVDATR